MIVLSVTGPHLFPPSLDPYTFGSSLCPYDFVESYMRSLCCPIFQFRETRYIINIGQNCIYVPILTWRLLCTLKISLGIESNWSSSHIWDDDTKLMSTFLRYVWIGWNQQVHRHCLPSGYLTWLWRMVHLQMMYVDLDQIINMRIFHTSVQSSPRSPWRNSVQCDGDRWPSRCGAL